MSPEARERSFDELARGLASGTLSRGRALKLMGAALVGGTLASLGIGEAAANDCKRNGKRCKKNTQCCSGNCVNGTCAQTCTFAGDGGVGECTGANCNCFPSISGPPDYCAFAVVGSGKTCVNDSECPPGEFCGGDNACYVAC
jgi:hypothetical protein